jgi:hypothetical protein
VPGCECAPAQRCPFYSFCRAAKLESSTAGRLERALWLLMVGVFGSLALYALVPVLLSLF